MAKPSKKAYSLREIAQTWSKLWRDEVSEDDVLAYARDGQLVLQTLIARRQFHVLNRQDINDIQGRIAPDGTTFLFNTFAALESKWAEVLLQGETVPVVRLTFNDMDLEPVGGVLNFDRKEIYILHEDKIRFESIHSNANELDKPLSTTERNTLLKQIGALSLSLAEQSNKYKRGEKPNVLQIAIVAGEIIDALPSANAAGVGASNLRENIRQGIDLLIAIQQ